MRGRGWMCRGRRPGASSTGQCSELSPPEVSMNSQLQEEVHEYLGDRLGSGFQVGFSLTAPPRLVQKILHLFMVLRAELLCPILELVQSVCSQDVVHRGHKRKVNPCLLVKLMHQLMNCVACFASFSEGFVVEEDGSVDKEWIPHPIQSETSPIWVAVQ